MSKNNNWYSITNKASGVLDISIHDEIGYYGITAADFMRELRSQSDISVINLSIHSPGGSMIEGFAMYNALKSHPAKVYAHIEGVAASMAGYVFMAGDVRSMPVNAYFMAHAPSGGAVGTSNDLRSTADLMDKFRDSVASVLRQETSLDDDKIFEMLDEETWVNGEEALAMGIVHTITDKVEIANKSIGFDRHFKAMPISNNNDQVENIETVKDFERFLRDSGGVSRRVATALSSRAKVVFQSNSESPPDTSISELLDVVSRFKVPKSL
ncbi:Clp protease ClpP [Pseudomonadota bacterium]|nr:Clp protease ClpP [Pseudomonadota bacterium]